MDAEQLENLQAVIDNYGEPDDTIIVDNALFNDNKTKLARVSGTTPMVVENIVGKEHGKLSFDVF